MASIDSAQLFIESITLLHTSVRFFHLNNVIAILCVFVKLLEIINVKTDFRNKMKSSQNPVLYVFCAYTNTIPEKFGVGKIFFF